MTHTAVVTAFLRHMGDVLLLKRSEEVGSYAGQWGAVSGHAEAEPDTAVRTEIAEETGLDAADVTLVRRGEPFEFADGEYAWRVHPYLFDAETREVSTNWESAEWAWVSPTAIVDRDTVPKLWTSYDHVRPSVESVARDTTHGSAYISRRALEVLRDETAVVQRASDSATQAAMTPIAETAKDLLTAHPAMRAVANRIHRVMSAAESPTTVENRAHDGIKQAVQVERAIAATAGELIGDRVATLSRSGTVRETLERTLPELLLVSESRPGGEGITVAEAFADDTNVVLTSDTAFAGELDENDIETLVIGADTVLADGCVVNKVGTRSAAIAATHHGIPTLVLAATDKISPESGWTSENADHGDLYTGDRPVTVSNPTFETTPASAIDSIVTEEGRIEPTEIEEIAADHRQRRAWLGDS